MISYEAPNDIFMTLVTERIVINTSWKSKLFGPIGKEIVFI